MLPPSMMRYLTQLSTDNEIEQCSVRHIIWPSNLFTACSVYRQESPRTEPNIFAKMPAIRLLFRIDTPPTAALASWYHVISFPSIFIHPFHAQRAFHSACPTFRPSIPPHYSSPHYQTWRPYAPFLSFPPYPLRTTSHPPLDPSSQPNRTPPHLNLAVHLPITSP